jgi:hypothetical protein
MAAIAGSQESTHPPSVGTNLVKKCWQVVRRFLAYLRRERRIRKAAGQLAQFDDLLLRDMGRVSTGVGSSAPSGMAGTTDEDKGLIPRSCVSL